MTYVYVLSIYLCNEFYDPKEASVKTRLFTSKKKAKNALVEEAVAFVDDLLFDEMISKKKHAKIITQINECSERLRIENWEYVIQKVKIE